MSPYEHQFAGSYPKQENNFKVPLLPRKFQNRFKKVEKNSIIIAHETAYILLEK